MKMRLTPFINYTVTSWTGGATAYTINDVRFGLGTKYGRFE